MHGRCRYHCTEGVWIVKVRSALSLQELVQYKRGSILASDGPLLQMSRSAISTPSHSHRLVPSPSPIVIHSYILRES